jgi:hypothetical protein
LNLHLPAPPCSGAAARHSSARTEQPTLVKEVEAPIWRWIADVTQAHRVEKKSLQNHARLSKLLNLRIKCGQNALGAPVPARTLILSNGTRQAVGTIGVSSSTSLTLTLLSF